MLEGVRLAGPASEDRRAQMRRIVCRMVGDLVQPWVFRSGNLRPWAPDLGSARGRREIGTPEQHMAPQCEVGFPQDSPVAWPDVLALLPCMADDALLDDMEASLRAHACLLPDDSLVPVNLGPQMASPVSVREREWVLQGPRTESGQNGVYGPHPDSDNAPMSKAPCRNRLVHVQVRQPGLPVWVHCRVAMRAPHVRPEGALQLLENVASLRDLFDPCEIAARLTASTEGADDVRHYPEAARTHHVATLCNQLLVRRKVIEALQRAMASAPYRERLAAAVGGRIVTWACIQRVAGLGQAYAADLLHAWRRIPVWSDGGSTGPQPQANSRFLPADTTLLFRAPRPPSAGADFLRALLHRDNALLVSTAGDAHAFWR